MEMDKFWKYYSSIGLKTFFETELKVLVVAVKYRGDLFSVIGQMTNVLMFGRQTIGILAELASRWWRISSASLKNTPTCFYESIYLLFQFIW